VIFIVLLSVAFSLSRIGHGDVEDLMGKIRPELRRHFAAQCSKINNQYPEQCSHEQLGTGKRLTWSVSHLVLKSD